MIPALQQAKQPHKSHWHASAWAQPIMRQCAKSALAPNTHRPAIQNLRHLPARQRLGIPTATCCGMPPPRWRPASAKLFSYCLLLAQRLGVRNHRSGLPKGGRAQNDGVAQPGPPLVRAQRPAHGDERYLRRTPAHFHGSADSCGSTYAIVQGTAAARHTTQLSTHMQAHGHAWLNPDVHAQVPEYGKAGALQAFPLAGSPL